MTTNSPIRFLDLAAINRRHATALKEAAAAVIDSGWYILGRTVEDFEKEFAAYNQRHFCIGVASGLDALTLALRAAIDLGKIADGSEIIMPANTYIASVLAAVQAGLIPRFLEPEETTHNLSAVAVEKYLHQESHRRSKVGAVMSVHLYGQASDMAELETLCKKQGLFLLSDAAQGHGAMIGEKSAAAFGDATAFSFYPGKNLGALGDGGSVVTDDSELAEHIRILRNYGSHRKYENNLLGVNSRLDEMQAALLLVKLPFLQDDNNRRRALAKLYCEQIKNPLVTLPIFPQQTTSHVWHVFVIRCRRREELQQHLKSRGVETLVHYPIPPHRQQAFAGKSFVENVTLPLTEQLADEVLSLPLHPMLSENDIERVSHAINDFA